MSAQSPPTHMPSPYDPYGFIEPTHPRGLAALAIQLYGSEQRHEMIAQAAYFRAMHRGFVPGHEIEDWLAAEMEVDAALTLGLPH